MSYSSSSSPYQSTTIAGPPPPPPKPQTPMITTATTTGPPLPPPPPPSTNTPQTANPSQPPPPPDPSTPWLPSILLDKSSASLQQALHSPPLVHSLSLQHPILTPSPLLPQLHSTQTLAAHVSTQYEALLELRQRTQAHLLRLHALERQWREKQAGMDAELAPWGAKVLYRRLREGEREGEEVCEGLERGWLDGEGGDGSEGGMMMGEREVGEFLRGYREGRVKVWRRREARERWDEGRVGGWR